MVYFENAFRWSFFHRPFMRFRSNCASRYRMDPEYWIVLDTPFPLFPPIVYVIASENNIHVRKLWRNPQRTSGIFFHHSLLHPPSRYTPANHNYRSITLMGFPCSCVLTLLRFDPGTATWSAVNVTHTIWQDLRWSLCQLDCYVSNVCIVESLDGVDGVKKKLRLNKLGNPETFSLLPSTLTYP
jgi:hypothetical protein